MSTVKPLNNTIPFPALVPISRVAVPCNAPVPVNTSTTLLLEPSPFTESLLN